MAVRDWIVCEFMPARDGRNWAVVFGLPRCYLFVKPSKGHEPLFSERYGYKKALYFAGIRIELMRPRRKRAA